MKGDSLSRTAADGRSPGPWRRFLGGELPPSVYELRERFPEALLGGAIPRDPLHQNEAPAGAVPVAVRLCHACLVLLDGRVLSAPEPKPQPCAREQLEAFMGP
jgi:hypothetical protein